MEKLQKALQKARDQRGLAGAATSSPAAARSPVEQADGRTAAEAAWDNIDLFEPDPKLLDKNLLLSLQADPRAQPFDILRTKAQIMMRKNGWSRLAVTSPTSACGKTTMACNLALGFSRQSDIRVILFELDLRRPNIARLLDRQPKHDVTDMLAKDVPFSEQAIRVSNNVAISMSRKPSTDPTSILFNQRTHSTLAEIEATYAPDLMIFDLPPILVSDDTRAFLKDVDCTLIVAKAEATSIAQIDACEREVAEHTNVLGVVLNQCRHVTDTDYGYEKYYCS